MSITYKFSNGEKQAELLRQQFAHLEVVDHVTYRKELTAAIGKMIKHFRKHYGLISKYRPHQSKKELARRVKQLSRSKAV